MLPPGRERILPVYHELPRVYVYIGVLPASCLPGLVIRHLGVTLLWVASAIPYVEVAAWVRDQLTEEERMVLRLAYDLVPDPTLPPDDAMLNGRTSARTPVPDCLRLPSTSEHPILRTIA